MIKKFWNDYYKVNNGNDKPSNFSIFINKKFIGKNTHLLDIGSGDGRDTFFLIKKAFRVMSIDFSTSAIKNNKLKSKRLNIKNVTFKCMSSNDLSKTDNEKINFIYGRFFLHAINESSENKFLKIVKNNFSPKTIIALEFRTTKDVLMKKGKKITKYERMTDHYRRFIDVNQFIEKIKIMNFKILYKTSGINLSKSPGDNPHLCRVVFSLSSLEVLGISKI
jgi:ubiquinone/menaquinone biosynthesis C-methylase UbiE